MTTCFTVRSDKLYDWWSVVEPFIRACEETQFEWTTDYVQRALLERDAQLWCVNKKDKVVGIFVTRLEAGIDGAIGRVWIAAGELKDCGVAVFRDHIEPWFAEKGCQRITFDGRPGWAKILPDYHIHSIKMVKELCSAATQVH